MKTIEQFGLLTGHGETVLLVESSQPVKAVRAKAKLVKMEKERNRKNEALGRDHWQAWAVEVVQRVFIAAAPEGIEPPLFPANTTACVI